MHPLANPFWHALSGPQAQFSLGDSRARRYCSGLATQAGLAEPDEPGFASLLELVEPGETVDLFWSELARVPIDWDRVVDVELQQMVLARPIVRHASGHGFAGGPGGAGLNELDDGSVERFHGLGCRGFDLLELAEEDVPEMLELARKIRPGPLLEGSVKLGRFVGVRHQGRLVAMAGERGHLEGAKDSQVNGICTHFLLGTLRLPAPGAWFNVHFFVQCSVGHGKKWPNKWPNSPKPNPRNIEAAQTRPK